MYGICQAKRCRGLHHSVCHTVDQACINCIVHTCILMTAAQRREKSLATRYSSLMEALISSADLYLYIVY